MQPRRRPYSCRALPTLKCVARSPTSLPCAHSKEALFSGKSEIDQLQLILKTMGSPTEETWPGGGTCSGRAAGARWGA